MRRRICVDSRTDIKAATLSTESIASSSQPQAGAAAPCASCGAPLAADQRYCLECGERRVPMSSVLLGDSPPRAHADSSPPAAPPSPPATPGAPVSDAGGFQRNGTLTVIAGVGVLLLAMGVGVLIGRAGAAKQSAAPAQVITLASPNSTGSAGSGTGAEATFTGDWPAGTSGYTVQLQTLPQSGTAVSAVEAAKTSAGAKGAKAVGALKSEEFSSLTAGDYVIYSGVYHRKAEAEKALGGLRKSFPGAKVIGVSNGGSSSSGGSSPSSESSGSSSGGAGSNESHPAPPSALESLKGAKGKSYEEKSRNLPDVVETG
jgi:hypothetical protein